MNQWGALSAVEVWQSDMKDQPKSVEAFTRYLELGGSHARARAAVAQSNSPASVVPAKP